MVIQHAFLTASPHFSTILYLHNWNEAFCILTKLYCTKQWIIHKTGYQFKMWCNLTIHELKVQRCMVRNDKLLMIYMKITCWHMTLIWLLHIIQILGDSTCICYRFFKAHSFHIKIFALYREKKQAMNCQPILNYFCLFCVFRIYNLDML